MKSLRILLAIVVISLIALAGVGLSQEVRLLGRSCPLDRTDLVLFCFPFFRSAQVKPTSGDLGFAQDLINQMSRPMPLYDEIQMGGG